MKKSFAVSCLIFLGVWMSASDQIFGAHGYVVQPGDTLSTLPCVCLDDQVKLRRILGANPFLKEPGRIFDKEDGTIVVLTKPGEMLQGVKPLKIVSESVRLGSLRPLVVAKSREVPRSLLPLPEDLQNFLLIAMCVIAALMIYVVFWRGFP